MAGVPHKYEELLDTLMRGERLSNDSLGLGICEPTDDEVETVLALAEQSQIPIRSISLENSEDITERSAKLVAKFMKSRPEIRELNFSKCDIGEEGGKAIADAVRSATGLYRLNLNHATLGDEGAIALAQAIEENDSLTYLYIRDIGMTDRGAAQFAKSLSKNTSISVLNYAENDCSGEGVMKVFRTLRSHPSYTYVSLRIAALDEDQKKEAAGIILNSSPDCFMSYTGDFSQDNLGDAVKELLGRRRQSASGLRNPDALKGTPSVETLLEYERRLPAMEYLGNIDSIKQRLQAHNEARPTAAIDESLTIEKLLEKADESEFCLMDSPIMIKRFGEIVDCLGPFDAADLLDKGELNAFMERAVEAGVVGHIFKPHHWRGAVGQMRAVYNAMPEEGQRQVKDWPRVQAKAARSQAAAGIGV